MQGLRENVIHNDFNIWQRDKLLKFGLGLETLSKKIPALKIGNSVVELSFEKTNQ